MVCHSISVVTGETWVGRRGAGTPTAGLGAISGLRRSRRACDDGEGRRVDMGTQSQEGGLRAGDGEVGSVVVVGVVVARGEALVRRGAVRRKRVRGES